LTKTLDIWLKEYKEHGESIVKPKPANNKKLTEQALMEYFEENHDSYQDETAAYFGVSQSGVCRALKGLKITRKKR